MPLTLGQAATQAGRSKPTILKALKNGRLSGVKVGNEWQIEPAELFRVYPPEAKVNDNTLHSANPSENALEIAVLQAKLEAAERQIEDLREDRDQWRNTANRLISAPPAAPPRAGFLSALFGKGSSRKDQ
jgi:excisionase family DNA binding protein